MSDDGANEQVLDVTVEVENTSNPAGHHDPELAVTLPLHAQVRSALEAARPTTGY